MIMVMIMIMIMMIMMMIMMIMMIRLNSSQPHDPVDSTFLNVRLSCNRLLIKWFLIKQLVLNSYCPVRLS